MGELITIFIGAGAMIGILYYLYKRNFKKKQQEQGFTKQANEVTPEQCQDATR